MAQSTVSLRIGTRGSPLALVQARAVRARVAAAMGMEEGGIELVVIRTTGDIIQDRSLAEEGGKGLFTKEIEEALLAGHIDLAVHSAKDMPTLLPGGLILAACLEREDPRDVFISRKARASAPHRRAGRRSPSVRGRICVCCRCEAMSTRGCASSMREMSMPHFLRLPGLDALG